MDAGVSCPPTCPRSEELLLRDRSKRFGFGRSVLGDDRPIRSCCCVGAEAMAALMSISSSSALLRASRSLFRRTSADGARIGIATGMSTRSSHTQTRVRRVNSKGP